LGLSWKMFSLKKFLDLFTVFDNVDYITLDHYSWLKGIDRE